MGNPAEALDSRFIFRRLDPDTDLPALVELYAAVDAVDQAGDPISPEELWATLHAPGYNVAQDAWYVADPANPARLIAEGWARSLANTRRGLVGGRVHPAWRRQGLGRAVLMRTLARARTHGSGYVTLAVDARRAASHAFLATHGFRREQTISELYLAPGAGMDAPIWPAGYSVRPYSAVNDPAILTEATNRGFLGHWEHRDLPVSDIIAQLALPYFTPEGILLAFGPAGDVAGFCRTVINPQYSARHGAAIGQISQLAVVPEHRRHGLGRALLRAGIQWLRAQGQEAIELGVMSDNAQALDLYVTTGFTATKQLIIYRHDL